MRRLNMERFFNKLFLIGICGILIVLTVISAYYGYTKNNMALFAYAGFYCVIIFFLIFFLLNHCKTLKNNRAHKDNSSAINKGGILTQRLEEFALAETLPPEAVAERPTFKDDGFCPYCKTEKMERYSEGTIIITNCKKCHRNFSNVGPVYANGKILIANFGEGFLKEMIPIPLEDDIFPYS